jgi:hypothetical protein
MGEMVDAWLVDGCMMTGWDKLNSFHRDRRQVTLVVFRSYFILLSNTNINF